MCSVVGYIGAKQCKDFILEGLLRLEYRGYDSAGFACLDMQQKLRYCKAEGRLANLTNKCAKESIDGSIGIGHTRWSTHGKPSEINAHPQFDCNTALSIVHNGIIENYHYLKTQLLSSGHTFRSDTDTEIIAHLLEFLIVKHATIREAVIELVSLLQGNYAFICIMEAYPDDMILVRKRSPLCIGVGQQEMFVASDVIAFADKTQKVIFLQDESFALVTKDFVEQYDFNGNVIPTMIHAIAPEWYQPTDYAYEHVMLKEIYEQKQVIQATVDHMHGLQNQLWYSMGLSLPQVLILERISLVACGTSWHAARIAQFFFESICHIPTKVYLASEMRYMPVFKEANTLYIAISQSGETADTLEVVHMFKDLQMPVLALTNVASSSIVREAGGVLLTQAGPERAVASTKAFSTQLTALYMLAHYIAYEKGFISQQSVATAQQDLAAVASLLQERIEYYKKNIKQQLAPYYAQFTKSIFLGRNISYPFAMEAALKLKEISYIFAQCYPAGELKHGPLALIDEHLPVFIFSCQDPVIYQKLLSNAQEAKARGGQLVVFCFEDQKELIEIAQTVFVFPAVTPLLEPLVMTGVMQYFVYEIARVLGCAIDKPRNLAKSVTVE